MAFDQQSSLFRVFSERWSHYMEKGDLERAERLGRTALDAARRAVEERQQNMPFLVESLRQMALTRLSRQDTAGAGLIYQEAIALATASPFVPDRQRALLKGGLAAELESQGKTDEAISCYSEAIGILEDSPIDENRLAANFRNNLGLIYKKEGRLELAEENYLLALDALETVYGRMSLEVASVYNNIGGLYQAAGHLDRALEMHLSALDIRQELGGEATVESGQSLSNIAAAYHALGCCQEAASHYERACAVLTRHRYADPETYAIASENYRLLLEETGQPREDVNPRADIPAVEHLNHPVGRELSY